MTGSAKGLFIKNKSAQPALIYFIYGINLTIITFFWWRGSSLEAQTLHGILTIIGRYTGLVSAYAALWQMLLIGRVPVLKQALGMEKEFYFHRWNGYITIASLIAHLVFLTVGYAMAGNIDLWTQLIDFIFNYDDVYNATVGAVLMVGLGGMSAVIIRKHLKYETWYLVHLTSYLAIILAFAHQLSTGGDFIRQPGFAIYWQALYIIVFGLIVLIRIVLPAIRWRQHDFRVKKIIKEAQDIYSIHIGGRHLNQVDYEPGQFAIWHFLAGENGWQGHPFSFSSYPGQSELRVTFKNVGDYTSQLKDISVGTPVILEGPFGKFTPQRLHQNKVLLIAGGIGLTPIMSMLPALVKRKMDIVLIYCARSDRELVFQRELEKIAAQGVKVSYITEDGSKGISGRLDTKVLEQTVSGIREREVFLCGPTAMMSSVTGMLQELGVPKDKIYSERFSLHTT
jgi:predicted ferric reductase